MPARIVSPTSRKSPSPSLTSTASSTSKPLPREPLHVRRALGLALRKAELGAVGDAVDHEAAVGGVDHVGQALDRVDEVHVVTEAEVRVVQRLPLRRPRSAVSVGWSGCIHGLIR